MERNDILEFFSRVGLLAENSDIALEIVDQEIFDGSALGAFVLNGRECRIQRASSESCFFDFFDSSSDGISRVTVLVSHDRSAVILAISLCLSWLVFQESLNLLEERYAKFVRV